MSMSSKTTPFSLELFPFVKQLAGLIEEHLDLGPRTGFKKHLPAQVPAEKLKKFILTPSNCVETFRC